MKNKSYNAEINMENKSYNIIIIYTKAYQLHILLYDISVYLYLYYILYILYLLYSTYTTSTSIYFNNSFNSYTIAIIYNYNS